MLRLPPFQLRKQPRSARGRFAISTRRTRTSRPWSETRSRDIPIFLPLIPMIQWQGGYVPLLRRVARPSHGGERASLIRRQPTGHTCGGTRRGRTRATRIGALPFLRRHSIPHQHLPHSRTICRRRQRRRLCTSSGRCSSSMIRYLDSPRRRWHRSSSWRRRRRNLWCSTHHLRPLESSCCRFPTTTQSRFG
jgi:hypothetical protein